MIFASFPDGPKSLQSKIVRKDLPKGKKQIDRKRSEEHMVSVQCFPLYSILLAVNQTRVDYFSLDIEGYELKVLQTIPWDKVDIKV